MDYIIYSVEDDEDISRLINLTLTKQGYKVYSFLDGKSLYKGLEKEKPNMILLDMMLPDISGTNILKNLRSQREYDEVEILIVSANTLLMDKVDGLDLGADDYIEKPFDILELMSRVNAKVRRYKSNRHIHIREYSLDLDKQSFYKDDKQIFLTNREFDILSLLFKHKNEVVTRDEILNKIWDTDAFIETRTVDMHIKSIRKKTNDIELIKTVHGKGYIVNS